MLDKAIRWSERSEDYVKDGGGFGELSESGKWHNAIIVMAFAIIALAEEVRTIRKLLEEINDLL